jgi:glycosyltransferase involved in cell wall biosynthesis
MKILYFHQHFNTPAGSVGVRSYQMARALIAAGHEVTIVCGSYRGGATGLSGPYIKGRRSGIVEDIEVIEFELPYSNALGFLKRALIFLQFAFRSTTVALTHKYDLIFATSTPLTAGIPGIFARWLRGKPFVFEVRDLWPELPKAMGVITNPIILLAMSILEWSSYHSATRLIALAGGIAQGIAKRGIPEDRIITIPNGCDLDIFTPGNEQWRPEGIATENLLAVFSGTHGTANGLDAVLDAAIELKQRNRDDIKFVLIGDGQQKAELVSRAMREDINSIIFLDPVGKAELAKLLSGADIGLQILANVPAFFYGTSPNKFFDYISAGLPVLTNYPGWVADSIQEHDCGFAIPPADPSAFADALEAAAADPKSLERKGAAARKLAEEKFSRQYLSSQFVDWVTGDAVMQAKRP